ncbi:MAG TPA: sigma-70 family RNA polymerase sigma factor [Polyangia bacterium]|nr:sigma-70 family RNA polymerase sigma factor [Polyangia bacterium]
MKTQGVTATVPDDGGNDVEAAAVSPLALRALVEHHDRFLAFLERRIGRRDVAEEILQEAFARGIERGGGLRDEESAVAWFYRLLRNALVDHHRRAAAEARGLEAFGAEPREGDADPELTDAICACVTGYVETLKPEYAEALRRVELGGESVRDFARDAGLTANNAGVRLHRARESLRRRIVECCGPCAEHGCFRCECGGRPHTPVTSAP